MNSSFSSDNPTSAAGMLQQGRANLGWDLDQVSSHTKIPLETLEAMENGVWEKLPGIPYARAFIRTLAQLYGLDSRVVLQALRRDLNLPPESGTASESVTPLARESEKPGLSHEGGRGEGGSTWAWLLILALVVGVFVLLLYLKQNAEPEVPAAPPADTAVSAEAALPPVRTRADSFGVVLEIRDTTVRSIALQVIRGDSVQRRTLAGRDSLVLLADTPVTVWNGSPGTLRLRGAVQAEDIAWPRFQLYPSAGGVAIREFTLSDWNRLYDRVSGAKGTSPLDEVRMQEARRRGDTAPASGRRRGRDTFQRRDTGRPSASRREASPPRPAAPAVPAVPRPESAPRDTAR